MRVLNRFLSSPLVVRMTVAFAIAVWASVAAVAALPPSTLAAMPAEADSAGTGGDRSVVAAMAAGDVSADTSSADTACGGPGQRNCCALESEVGFCQPGTVLMEPCVGPNCACLVAGNAAGICATIAPCGGAGQRACLVGRDAQRRFGNDFQACEAGLRKVSGCNGDCRGVRNDLFSDDLSDVSLDTCMDESQTVIEEPDVNAAFLETPVCSLKGYADMHMHMFADQAHGGAVLAGASYNPAVGVNRALAPDFTTANDLVSSSGDEVGSPLLCDSSLPGMNCERDGFHLDHDFIAGDSVGSPLGTSDGARGNYGAPVFSGWPRWSSTTHQQVYYKWLERAWRGGLRLMTQLAVTNEAMCRGNRTIKGTNCFDSMASIDQQIASAFDFQSFLDNNYGGPGKGWFRIVTTPLEARTAIARGKLAVVLGIEVAELFNCYETKVFDDGDPNKEIHPGRCTDSFVSAEVDRYYNLGVRHIFPIHNFDNAFGSAATWQKGIEVGQKAVEGRWWDTEQCAPDSVGNNYGFKLELDHLVHTLISLLKFPANLADDYPPRSENASCNSRDLLQSSLGEKLMKKLMAKGMIIDVDHMSVRSFNQALDLTESNPTGVYPVVASHVLAFDQHDQEIRHERLRTFQQLRRIADGGGMVTAMLKDDVQDTGNKGRKLTFGFPRIGPRPVADDCRHSSKSFAQSYQYFVDVMGGSVAFGSDFNGIAAHFGPRFGSEACGGWPEAWIGDLLPSDSPGRRIDRASQEVENKRLLYPFNLEGFGIFDQQVTGQRTWDYNTHGLAHVGLLPDFVADLRTVGLPQTYQNAIFDSAKAYIEMWERATATTPTPDDDTPAAAVADTCGFVFNPQVAFEDLPSETFEGDPTPINFTALADWTITASCGGNAISSVLTKLPDSSSTRDEYRLDCAWSGGPWGMPQVGLVSITGTQGSHVKVTQAEIDVRNRLPVIADLQAEYEVTLPWNTLARNIMLTDAAGEQLTVTIAWGDGKTDTYPASPGGFGMFHPYVGVPTGTYAGTITVADEAGSVSKNFTVKVMPSSAVDQFSMDEGTTLTVPAPGVLLNDDLPAGATTEVELVSGPARLFGFPGTGTLVLNPNGGFTYTPPDPNFHTTVLKLQSGLVDVSDGHMPIQFIYRVKVNGTFLAPATANIKIFNAVDPPLTGPDHYQVTMNTPLVVASPGLLANDTPVDGRQLWVASFNAVSQQYTKRTNHGEVVIDTSVSPARGGFRYTPDPGFSGVDTFTYFARDFWQDSNQSGVGTVTITVVNPPPTLSITGAIGIEGNARPFTFTFGDPGQDTVTVTINWGDGSPTETISGGPVNPPVTRFHTYATWGPRTITAIAVDSGGATTTVTQNVTVRDNTPPVVTIDAPATVEATGATGAPVPFTVTVTDNKDTNLTYECFGPAGVVVPGMTLPLGSHSVQCDAKDAAGLMADATVTITVVDTTPPAITVNAPSPIEASSPNGAPVAFTATAVDLVDGSRPVSCSLNSGEVRPLGHQTFTCSSADTRGNSRTVTAGVDVRDTTPPAIAGHGNLVAEATSSNGAGVTYSAPGTSDIVDGAGSALCSPASGSTFTLGTTTVTCTASDAAGNAASSTSFSVLVQDTTAPSIVPITNITVEAIGPSGAPASITASASDLVSGAVAVSCPTQGVVFPLGPTTVTCSATDGSGNTGHATATIVVEDTTPPVITGNNVTVTAPTAGGVAVTLPVTAADLVTTNPTVSCLPASGAFFQVGTTPVTCTATDAAGNASAPVVFTVTVTFSTPPPPPPAGEGCFVVDFREITYFKGEKVLMSSDAGIRANNRISGPFNPAVWPYRAQGGNQYTTSRGTLFRIYGFAADRVGTTVRDADNPSVTYVVQQDAAIPGAYYVDLGGPRRVSICPEMLDDYVLAGEKGNGHRTSSNKLPAALRNVPGIMLTHNTQVVKVPTRIRREMQELDLPTGEKAYIDYIGFQLQGNGNAQFREFVDVEISFTADSEDDRLAHYQYGFHTAANTSFETFAGCNYLDAAPGNDAVRLRDVWGPNKSKSGTSSWQACGKKEPRSNERVRANYDVPFNAVQLLPTVNASTDTVRLFYGSIRPVPAREYTRNDHRKDWRDWDDQDERHERDHDRDRDRKNGGKR